MYLLALLSKILVVNLSRISPLSLTAGSKTLVLAVMLALFLRVVTVDLLSRALYHLIASRGALQFVGGAPYLANKSCNTRFFPLKYPQPKDRMVSGRVRM